MPSLGDIGAIAARGGKIHFALLLLILVGLVAVPPLRTAGNLLNILDQSAALGILALGQAFVIAGGLIDLSAGQLVGLVTVIACALMGTHPDGAWPIVFGVIAFAVVFGLDPGVLFAKGDVRFGVALPTSDGVAARLPAQPHRSPCAPAPRSAPQRGRPRRLHRGRAGFLSSCR